MNLKILVESKRGFCVKQIQTSYHKGNEGEEKQRVSTRHETYGSSAQLYASVGTLKIKMAKKKKKQEEEAIHPVFYHHKTLI